MPFIRVPNMSKIEARGEKKKKQKNLVVLVEKKNLHINNLLVEFHFRK